MALEVPKQANTLGTMLAIPMWPCVDMCFFLSLYSMLQVSVCFLGYRIPFFVWHQAHSLVLSRLVPLNHGGLPKTRSTFDQLKWLWIPDVRWDLGSQRGAVEVKQKWIWRCPKINMELALHSPFFIRLSIVNHPFWGTPIYGKLRMFHHRYSAFF